MLLQVSLLLQLSLLNKTNNYYNSQFYFTPLVLHIYNCATHAGYDRSRRQCSTKEPNKPALRLLSSALLDMPTTSSKTRRVIADKSASFNGRKTPDVITATLLVRPKTDTNLLETVTTDMVVVPRRMTKLLLNVTVQRSSGPVQVVMSPESTVENLTAEAIRVYVKEGRRPLLVTNDPLGFELHYSQFSLQSLNREEKLMTLGSRNFFLCPSTTTSTTSVTYCNQVVEKDSKIVHPWLWLMDFLL
ncbi:hypothetical protein GIB67_034068 [Kingdonia uniflora]|uniref:DUF7054 domain-containing protein n=1 Tax=Kingdonia uniflora TaxID=39325 RepID=A0A7J7M656_9MAGN|nr:hypothetical protein GIB67_034068 [Kingdonia uniflora]